VLGALFLILSFGLALVHKTPSDKGVEAAGRRAGQEQGSQWWQDETSAESSDQLLEAPNSDESAD